MTKPFHPGRRGARGPHVGADGEARLHREPAGASRRRAASRRRVSTKCDWNEITDELGERFEISFNTYKPFACGIVIHPTIDARVAAARRRACSAEDVERVELKVHSLVLELTGKKEPRDGLEAKFSVYHGFAAGLIFGRAGEDEFADDIVSRADVVALRAQGRARRSTTRSTRRPRT